MWLAERMWLPEIRARAVEDAASPLYLSFPPLGLRMWAKLLPTHSSTDSFLHLLPRTTRTPRKFRGSPGRWWSSAPAVGSSAAAGAALCASHLKRHIQTACVNYFSSSFTDILGELAETYFEVFLFAIFERSKKYHPHLFMFEEKCC
jgi:hypothetical protein